MLRHYHEGAEGLVSGHTHVCPELPAAVILPHILHNKFHVGSKSHSCQDAWLKLLQNLKNLSLKHVGSRRLGSALDVIMSQNSEGTEAAYGCL